jgi:signal transduction histidine kinase/ligand-binding sensor domain-containing protein
MCLALLALVAALRPASASPAGPPWTGSPGPLQAPAARFEHLTIVDGLSNNIVETILQDRYGFLWVGTDDGLNRYDGYEFTVFRHDQADAASLADSAVTVLYEDRAGELWVGTLAGLDRFDRASGTFVHYPAHLDSAAISGLYEDNAGTLWVGLYSYGLARLDRATGFVGVVAPAGTSIADFRRPSGTAISTFYEDEQGQLWLGSYGGLDRYDRASGTFVHYRHVASDPTSLSGGAVAKILEDSQGTLWVSTAGGLDRFDPATQSFAHYRNDPNDPNSLVDDRTMSVLEDRAGRLWVATLGGLDQLDRAQDRFLHYRHDPNQPFSLGNDIVLALYEDRSGVLWVGTYGGLSKYSPATSHFTLYQARPGELGGLSDNITSCVYEDRSGVLWVGTFNGGLNRLDRATGRATAYRHDPADPKSLAYDFVITIYEDPAGVLWVSLDNGWLDRFDPRDGTFLHADLSPYGGARVLLEDSAGKRWGGTGMGLALLGKAMEVLAVYRPMDDPYNATPVTALLEDRTGRLWVGTSDKGLYYWDDSRKQLMPYLYNAGDRQMAHRDAVLAIHEGPPGILWTSKLSSGLERLDLSDGAYSRYAPANPAGRANQQVRQCLLEDPAGFLWLGTSVGLSRFDPQTATFRNYGVQDGLPGGELLSCYRSKSGEVFFTSLNGLIAFDPAQMQDNAQPPPVVITALFKSNQRVAGDVQPGQGIQLAYNDNYVSFEYAALDYQAPGRNLYAYRMEGLDSGWTDAGTRRHADYPNLPPGDYVFRVKAANNDGYWNEEGAVLYIAVVPPLWGRWWFQGLMALALVGGALGAYLWRIRSIRTRNRDLETQVANRTRELAALTAAEQRRAEQFRVLAEIGRQITSVLDIDQLLVQVVRLVQQTFSYYHVGVGMIEGDEVVYRVGAGALWDDPGFQFRPAQLKVGREGLTGWVASTGEPVLVGDVSQDPRYVWMQGSATRSECVVPIKIKGQVVGVLDTQSDRPDSFDATDLAVLQLLAHQAGVAIENARLYGQAQEAAVLAERNRVARDLHDSVTQSLYSLTLMAEAGQRMIKARDLARVESNQARVSEIAQQALQEMRLFVYELRPLTMEEGLAGALEHRLEAVERRAGMEARLVVEGECSVPGPVQEELYRIAHEALNNALKHAKASAVTVTLRTQPDGTYLEVRDNGRGFDPAAASRSGGMGLSTMQERAARVGGRTTIQSAPGQGTSVQVIAPVADSRGVAAAGPDTPGAPEVTP